MTLLLSLSLLACKGPADTGDTADTGIESADPAWGYDDADPDSLGPSYWADAYPDCAGAEQSPRDLDPWALEGPSQGGTLALDYGLTGLHAINNGHAIEYVIDAVEVEGDDVVRGGQLTIDGVVYALKQLHFHSTSEHAVDGVTTDMEMHMVHESAAGDVAVLGVLIVSDALVERPNLFVDADSVVTQGDAALRFHDALALPVSEQTTDLGGELELDRWFQVLQDGRFLHYQGSFTTPPCTQGVQWFIADSALVVRVQDRDAFRQVYDGNNRPLQSNPNPVTATDGAGWGAD